MQALLGCTRHWAIAQTAAVSKVVQMDHEELRVVSAFSKDCQQLVGAVLDHRVDVLFGQHLSNVVACCIYATARLLDVVISFKRITTACMEVSNHVPPRVFKTAQLQVHPPAALEKNVFATILHKCYLQTFLIPFLCRIVANVIYRHT